MAKTWKELQEEKKLEREQEYDRIKRQIQETRWRINLTRIFTQNFLVKSCSNCNEIEMLFISISPNSRSIEYQCMYCNKKMRADSDGSPNAREAKNFYDRFANKATDIFFTIPEESNSFQSTVREPIPESVRNKVWRRDSGQCVKCSSKENLEFDHIIPVSKGGANTARNLQLLCETCNRSKGARI